MARYTGPRTKVVRRLRQELPGLTRRTAERRPYPPGQHGAARRQRASDYRVRLDEKQKLRFHYGVSERQLQRYYARAASKKGDTGLMLLQALESRLDSILFRAGFAPTIPSARQLISHGHVSVNGRMVTVPGYATRTGNTIAIRAGGAARAQHAIANPVLTPPSFLSIDQPGLAVTLTSAPTREEIPFDVHEELVVEHYS